PPTELPGAPALVPPGGLLPIPGLSPAVEPVLEALGALGSSAPPVAIAPLPGPSLAAPLPVAGGSSPWVRSDSPRQPTRTEQTHTTAGNPTGTGAARRGTKR